MINQDIVAGKWKQLSGKARVAWGEITDDDWTKIDGNAERLAGLIQERYGKSREQARKEVDEFFARNG